MPRRAFAFFFRTTCSRCLHPIGRLSPQGPESLAGPFISHAWINSMSFRTCTRRNGFVFPSHLRFSDAGKPISLGLLYALLKIFSPMPFLPYGIEWLSRECKLLTIIHIGSGPSIFSTSTVNH